MFVRMGVYLRARACKNVMLHVCVCGRLYVRSCAYIVCMCELERVGICMCLYVCMCVHAGEILGVCVHVKLCVCML